MDLTCSEEMIFDSPNKMLKSQEEDLFNFRDEKSLALTDETLINDRRVLKNMLEVEKRVNGHSFCYFKVQTELTQEMRTTVTTWMFDVCEAEGLSKNVFLLSVSYMDRFLTMKKIEKSQFQLLASVCMLIASKWVGTTLSLEKLVFYTAFSLPREMLLSWELLLLSQFKWDAFSLTPNDFVEHILYRLPDNLWRNAKENGGAECLLGVGDEGSCQWKTVESQVKKFVCEMFRLGVYICPACLHCPVPNNKSKIHLPSKIASAAIAVAIGDQVSQSVFGEILHRLHVITKIEVDVLRPAVDQLRLTVQLSKSSATTDDELPNSTTPSISNSDSDSMDHCDLGEMRKADTPTDVGEIFF